MKLSIITINRNNANGLIKTIESVIAQTFDDFEYIVVDGASNDNSVDVIKQYQDHITYWISEPDSGIYNAMNKGIKCASGEYCLFLNSGDCLSDKQVLTNVFKEELKEITVGYVKEFCSDKSIRFPSKFVEFRILYHANFPHQAEFIKRTLFDQYGYYSEDLRILSDYEFNIKCVINNCSIKFLDLCVSFVEAGGISSVDCSQIDKERSKIFDNILPKCIINDYEYWYREGFKKYQLMNWLEKNKTIYRFIRFLYSVSK